MDGRRIFDWLLVLIVLPFALPLMVVVALGVRWQLGSPILFRQLRPGLHGQVFCLYKFRTMRLLRPHESMLESDGIRITALGRFLRKTGLDELPCLYNIIRGDLSWVGPRPLLPEYLPLYNAHQAKRHAVRPGLTGWAQVHGRNVLDWPARFDLDVWYVEHRTLWLDLKILWLTALLLFRGHGATPVGRETSEPFRGNP